MNFDNPFLYNSCYYVRFNMMSEEIFEQCKIISNKVLDAEKDENKMLVVQNQFYEGGGYEYMFLFFEESKTLNYINELDSVGAIDFYKNVTEHLIDGHLEQNDDFRNVYFGFSEQGKDKKSEFADLFDFFLLKNRTVDHVIDRISKLGIDNIWDIDKEILKKSNSNHI